MDRNGSRYRIFAFLVDVLTLLPGSGYCDMPTLFEELIKSGGKVATFPLREYRLDIGQLSGLERGRREFKDIFR